MTRSGDETREPTETRKRTGRDHNRATGGARLVAPERDLMIYDA